MKPITLPIEPEVVPSPDAVQLMEMEKVEQYVQRLFDEQEGKDDRDE